MAIPRVFISSTCYDLKHIRENLKYFVRTIGYEPVLSDDGDVFYNPSTHTHDSCLKEVETCQLFILIIGGRYGGLFNGSEKSITNTEYQTAVSRNIPVFALVEHGVYSDHFVYSKNLKQPDNIANQINYPSSDSTKIFEFIDEVRRNVTNNALFSFRDFSDMETYLKKQWAGMMYDFLSTRLDEERATKAINLLENLNIATKKTEELLKLVARQNNSSDSSDIENKIEVIDRVISATQYISYLLNFQNMKGYFRDVTAEEFYSMLTKHESFIELLRNLPRSAVLGESKDGAYDFALNNIDGSEFFFVFLSSLTEKQINETEVVFTKIKGMNKGDIVAAYNSLIPL